MANNSFLNEILAISCSQEGEQEDQLTFKKQVHFQTQQGNVGDRLFNLEPPSSLFDTCSFQKYSLSEMATPHDEPLQQQQQEIMRNQQQRSPKPSNRNIKFDWKHLPPPKPVEKKAADPFVDDKGQGDAKVAFTIKSPFPAKFNTILPIAPATPILDGPSVEKFDNKILEASSDISQSDISEQMEQEYNNIDDLESRDPSWLESDDPLAMYRNLKGGSLVEDDFYELKKGNIQEVTIDMDQHIDANDNLQFGNTILDADNLSFSTGHDDIDHGSNDFDNGQFEEKGMELSSILPQSTMDQQTPHHTRTIQSLSEDLFSPGSFFASKSGQLGDLEAKSVESRPTWYTPKHDEKGRLIDPIGKTPNDRPEKDSNGIVRRPLYIPTPSVFRNITLSRTEEEEKIPLKDQVPNQVQVDEAFDENKDDLSVISLEKALSNIDNEVDPFDWNAALEETIPDTIVDDPSASETTDADSISTRSISRISAETKAIEISSGSHASPVNISISAKGRKPIRSRVELFNGTSKSTFWSLKPVGQSSIARKDKTDAVSDSIFKFDVLNGKIEAGSSKKVSFIFMPIQYGTYTSLFQLKTSSGVISIWIKGFALENQKSDKNISPLNTRVLDIASSPYLAKVATPMMLQSIQSTKSLKSSTSSRESQDNYDPVTPRVRKMAIDKSLKTPTNTLVLNSMGHSTGKKLGTPKFTRHTLNFGNISKNAIKTLYLRVCNPDYNTVEVYFTVTGDFAVPVRELKMTPRSFFILPVCFKPKTVGIVDERLIVRKNQSTIRLALSASVQ